MPEGLSMPLPKVRLLYEGPSFRLGLAKDILIGEAWAVESFTLEEGAALVDIQRQLLLQLAEQPVRGVLYDLRGTVENSGPRSSALIIEAMRHWSAHGKPVALVVKTSGQHRAYSTLAKTAGADCPVFFDPVASMDWLEHQLPVSEAHMAPFAGIPETEPHHDWDGETDDSMRVGGFVPPTETDRDHFSDTASSQP